MLSIVDKEQYNVVSATRRKRMNEFIIGDAVQANAMVVF